MPQITGGGSSVSKKAARKIGRRAAVSGEKTGRVNAARSKALVTTGTQRKALSRGYTKGATARAYAGDKLPAKLKGRAKANAYLAKSSGTTKGEVQGVRAAIKTGKMTRKEGVRALSGGPRAGVRASKKNTKRVRRALSR